MTVDFESLSQVNDDVVGWIYSDDTPINYPVVQADDNQYYLHRLIDHSEDFAGSIFMDYRNTRNFYDLNTILYGHNMKNQSMFSTLQAYNDQDYFDTHPILYLLTPKQAYKIELIASFGTTHTSDIYQIPDTYEKQVELLTTQSNSPYSLRISLSKRMTDSSPSPPVMLSMTLPDLF